MISKEEFVDAINVIEKYYEWTDKVGEAFGCDIETPNIDTKLIDLLEQSFGLDSNDIYGTDITYFIFELNFGKDYKPGCVTDKDGNDIDFSTAEKLYDYIKSSK